MCGNGVSLDIAVECFNACSGLHRSLVTQTMSKWYSTWDRHPRDEYKAEYYSISFKEWLKINGEEVRPEVTVMQFGIDGIAERGMPQKVRTIIDHVRENKWRSSVARGYRHAIWCRRHRRNRDSSKYKDHRRPCTCKKCWILERINFRNLTYTRVFIDPVTLPHITPL